MNIITPVLLLTNLRAQTGGLHQAIYLRLQAMQEVFPIKLLTMDYDQDFDSNLEASIRRNDVPHNVEVLNIYRWFMSEAVRREEQREAPEHRSHALSYQCQGAVTHVRYRDTENSKHEGYRCFENGVYKRYEGFVDGKLSFIDYFSAAWVREEKHLYGREGNLEVVLHMDPVLNRPRLKRYMDLRGECFLSVRVNPETGVEGPFFLHGHRKQLANRWQFVWYWVDLIARSQANPVIFLDKRELISSAARSIYKKIYVLHSSHLLDSSGVKKELVPSLRPMLRYKESLDKIVVSTPSQRRDLIDCFEVDPKKIVAIPHFQREVHGLGPVDERLENKVVTIARYHPVKALHEAIHAFHKVLYSVPDATYDIYGYGALRPDLQSLIDSLGIGSQVKLKGFSSNYVECFSTAKVSVLTSKNEGFGVVIAESMACGTPVVSYETDFGPKYLIRDEVDGFLVKMGDRDLLAERIVELLINDEKRVRFAKAALEIVDRLSENTYRAQWTSLVRAAYSGPNVVG